jgi:hypothetical protein
VRGMDRVERDRADDEQGHPAGSEGSTRIRWGRLGRKLAAMEDVDNP